MKIAKQTAEYTIYQKRNKRYGVQGTNKNWINGEDKVKILLAEGLIKISEPGTPAEETAEESTEAEAADSTTESE